jgi:metal-responsive CopG/Arc/MetJ family transcriptional regulator
MSKIVIQVPIDEELLEQLAKMSKKKHSARAEIIRQACRHYLEKVEVEEKDAAYKESYRKIPESPAFGRAQVSMLKEVLSEEEW